MKSRWTLMTILGLAAVLVAANLRAGAQTKPKADDSAQIREDLALKQQILYRQFAEFEQALLRLQQRLERSTKAEERERAAILAKALEKSRDKSITTRFEQFVDYLKTGKLTSVSDIAKAVKQSNDLAEDLRDLIALLREDTLAAKKREERLGLEEMIKKLEGIIRDQKTAEGQTRIGKTETTELIKIQNKVTQATSKLIDQMSGKNGQGGEAKNAPGQSKAAGKDGGKKGESKDVGKDPSKKGEGREAGKSDGKPGEAKSGEAKAGDPKGGAKSGKGGEGSKSGGAKDSKSGQGSQGGAKENKGDGKEAGAKEKGGVKEKTGEAKGTEKSGDDKEKKGEQSASKSGGQGKEGQAGSKSGKGGESKSAESKSGGEKSKQGEAKAGQSGQSSSKSGQQQSGSQQAGSKSPPSASPPSPPQNSPPKQDVAQSKKRVEDGNYQQKQAEDNIAKGKNEPASDNQQKAIKDLEAAKKKLEDLLRQLREEELERLLAQLQARCEKMLAMQIQVLAGTEAVFAKIQSHKDKLADNFDKRDSLKLSDDEKEIVVEATKAVEMLEAEGSAVAFPEVFKQIREDMKHVQRRLGIVDTGAVTQAIEKDIIDTLKEMIEALKKKREEMDKNKKPSPPKSGNPPPNQDQKLLDQIAELKMIRSMQKRVNTRTEVYGNQYTGEQAAEPRIVGELRNLSERQERIFEVTNRIAKGDNK